VECDGAQVRLCELALLGRREIDFGCWNERDIYIYIYLFIWAMWAYMGPNLNDCVT